MTDTPNDRMFEDEIRHGETFEDHAGTEYRITNHPEKPDVEYVEFKNLTTGKDGKKPRDTIENWLQWGYWREQDGDLAL